MLVSPPPTIALTGSHYDCWIRQKSVTKWKMKIAWCVNWPNANHVEIAAKFKFSSKFKLVRNGLSFRLVNFLRFVKPQSNCPGIGTLSKKRGSQEDAVVNRKINFHSNGVKADRISVVWPPLLLDRVLLLKVPKVTIITRCDFLPRFLCIDATLLCEFESDKIWINKFE